VSYAALPLKRQPKPTKVSQPGQEQKTQKAEQRLAQLSRWAAHYHYKGAGHPAHHFNGPPGRRQ